MLFCPEDMASLWDLMDMQPSIPVFLGTNSIAKDQKEGEKEDDDTPSTDPLEVLGEKLFVSGILSQMNEFELRESCALVNSLWSVATKKAISTHQSVLKRTQFLFSSLVHRTEMMEKETIVSQSENLEETVPKKLTRSYLKDLCGGKQVDYFDLCASDEEEEEKDVDFGGLPINQLPLIYEQVMKCLPAEDVIYDTGKIQYLIVETAREYRSSSTQSFLEQILEVLKNEKTLQTKASLFSNNETCCKVVQRYNDYIQSDEEQRKAFFRTDSPFRHRWTRADKRRFVEAFKKYGDGPTSNKKIAEYIGSGVHANHVAYFKMQWKKQKKAHEMMLQKMKAESADEVQKARMTEGGKTIAKYDPNRQSKGEEEKMEEAEGSEKAGIVKKEKEVPFFCKIKELAKKTHEEACEIAGPAPLSEQSLE